MKPRPGKTPGLLSTFSMLRRYRPDVSRFEPFYASQEAGNAAISVSATAVRP